METEKMEFSNIFDRLKSILQPYGKTLVIKKDIKGEYQIYTQKIVNKKNFYFGGVAIKKNYVSFYLMPVYVFPELLNNVPGDLLKRMQGKSCFNFRRSEDIDEQKIQKLIQASYTKFKETGYIY